MYSVIISNSAEKDMEQLSSSVLKRISKAIDKLPTQPRPPRCLKLKEARKIYGVFE